MVISSNTFQDASGSAGIVWSRQRGTEAFTVNWTDLNNDGLLDLWVGGHGYNGPSLAFPDGKIPYRYINNGNGTFSLVNSDFRRGSGGDIHASAIADFDNDGDQDVFSSAGGQLGEGDGQPNLLFVNNAGNLQNEAGSRGVEYTVARGRSGLWFDGNGDGLLDILLIGATRSDGQGQTAFFQQRPDGTFFNASSQVGLNVGNQPARYAQLGDVNGDGNVDLIIQGTFEFPLRVYSLGNNGSWQDITGSLSNLRSSLNDRPGDSTQDFQDTTAPRDSIIADFNNDGFNDIFVVRSRTDVLTSSVFQGSDSIVSADLRLSGGSEIGFDFQTGGNIAVDLFNFVGTRATIDPSQVFIGSSGRNPTQAELIAFTDTESALKETANVANTEVPNFVLNSGDSSVVGLPANRNQKGLYLGYNPNSQTWEVRLSSPNNEGVQVVVQSTSNISSLDAVGFDTPGNLNAVNGVPDELWVYNPDSGNYEDRSAAAGVNNNTLAQSTVAGDFDNDGDLDIYVANAYASFNQPNILYDNQGDGTFTQVAQAGGAAGRTVGPHRLDFEIGQRIAVADYDNNGFLDIFAGSTTDRSPAGTTYLGTPSQLFRNQGNGNNWLILDLEGTESNRDGIGARVTVTTPDGNTQLREQGGGMHHFAQNSQRIHFGLGSNSSISSLVIQWPSGITQEFNNFSDINQVINVTENGTIEEPGGNEPGAGDDSLVGSDVGDLLNGGDGNDTLLGLEGPDTLNGDEGSDSIEGGGNNDLIDGGAGDDLLFGNPGTDTIIGGAGDDSINAGDGIDEVIAGDGNDTLEGDNGDDLLDGGAGVDVLVESGNTDFILTDTSLVGLGTDTLVSIEEAIITGSPGPNTLDASGSSIAVSFIGAGGPDVITGGNANDVLSGGIGADTLTGGGGSDRFVYSQLGDRNDTITDFQSGDTIAFSAEGFGGGLSVGAVGADLFTVGTSAGDESDRFIYNANNGNLIYDADGTGSTNQILVARLTNVPNFSNSDLEIIA